MRTLTRCVRGARPPAVDTVDHAELAAANGLGATKLTTGGWPSWPPDGKRIAFEHLGNGDTQPVQVFVMNADGANVHRVSVNTAGYLYAESDPAWSPDGSMLAYWSYGYGVVIADVGSGKPWGALSSFPKVSYGAKPARTHDGLTLAFNVWRSGPSSTRSVVAFEPYAGGTLEIVRDGYDVAYSPDDKRIAYTSTRNDST